MLGCSSHSLRLFSACSLCSLRVTASPIGLAFVRSGPKFPKRTIKIGGPLRVLLVLFGQYPLPAASQIRAVSSYYAELLLGALQSHAGDSVGLGCLPDVVGPNGTRSKQAVEKLLGLISGA